MELVIKLSDKFYENILNNTYDYGDMNVIIQNGTLLPKGHGRLIDADALTEKAPEIKEYLDVLAPTIIEGSEEEE